MSKRKAKDTESNIKKDYNENWEEIGIAKVHSDEIIDEKEIKKISKPKPKPKPKINYTISGLSKDLKRKALRMLSDGVKIKIVAKEFGVAPSDISILS